MEDRATVLLFIAIVVTVILLSFALAIWIVLKLSRKAAQPMSQAATGAIDVPVRQLMRGYRFFGYAKNGISPRLELTADGLHFKVFKPDFWRFAEIAEVDAPWMIFTTRLGIRHRESGRLYVDLAGVERARDLLRALPPGVPLPERAINMRDRVA